MSNTDISVDDFSNQFNRSLNALLENKKEQDDLDNSIRMIKDTIAKKQSEIQDERHNIDAISRLDSEREELLADISIGDKDQQDLKIFDEKYTTTVNSIVQNVSLLKSNNEQALQAIAGLNRKLKDLESKLAALETDQKNLQIEYCKADASLTYFEYLDFAEKIKIAYMRLSTLNKLIKGNGGADYFPYSTEFNIPSLRISGFDDRRHPIFNDIITSSFALGVTGEIDNFYKSLSAEFTEKGIFY
jgi:chromosome segregation ATPase